MPTSDLTLRAMRAFLAVLRHGTVTEAARQLNITQPALSRLVARLEAETGLPLFRRERRRLIPSEQAILFAREAQRVVDALDEIPQIAEDLKHDSSTVLRVVALPRLAFGLVAPAFMRVRRIAPEVRLVVDVRMRREIERWVASRLYDIGLASLPVRHSNVVIEPFTSVPLTVVLPSHHRLAGHSQLSLEDMNEEPFVIPVEGTMIRERIGSLFLRSNIALKAEVETSSSDLACHFVAEGFGYTITDPFLPANTPGRLVAIPLVPRTEVDLAFVGPRGRHKQSRISGLFKEAVRQEALARGGVAPSVPSLPGSDIPATVKS